MNSDYRAKFLNGSFSFKKKFSELDSDTKLLVIEKKLRQLESKLEECRSNKLQEKEDVLKEIENEVKKENEDNEPKILLQKIMDEIQNEVEIPIRKETILNQKQINNKVTQINKRIQNALKNKCKEGSLNEIECERIKQILNEWYGKTRTEETIRAFEKIEEEIEKL